MKKKETKKAYTLTLSPSIMKEVERLTEKVGTENKSQMVEKLLSTALDDMKLFEKAGLLDMVLAGRDIVGKFKSKIFNGEIKTDEKGELQFK